MGCVRFFWNQQVASFLSYKKNEVSAFQWNSTETRGKFDWMREVSAGAIQQKDRDFQEFKRQFFSKTRKKKIGKPKFKKKSSRGSYRLPDRKFKLLNHAFRLEKVGVVKAVIDRRPPKGAKHISVTISRDCAGAYFVSLLTESEEPKIQIPDQAVGVDLGLTHFATLSSGGKIENPRYLRKSQAKLKKAHRRLSRKVKGSRRHAKAKLRVARMHRKVANQRNWFHHDLSSKLSKSYSTICIESLAVANMVKNRRLAKAISDAGWSQFCDFLTYKSERVVRVGQFFASSKVCSSCDCKTNQTLTLKVRNWTCETCFAMHDRDFNASVNILKEGLSTAQGVACALRIPSLNKTLASTAQAGSATAIGVEESKKQFSHFSM